MRVARQQAIRRRWFLATAAVAILATAAVVVTSWGDVAERTRRDGDAATPTSHAAPPPAWLAWMSGGFPDGFRNRADDLAGPRHAVVVAGDTRWMTASHDSGGDVVDRPDPPYRIPIDAFAVDPEDYRPFLPDDVRDTVVSALEDGLGVLGTTSARLRRLGVGGSLSFGNHRVRIGAVVPDRDLGWSELLVSRAVGAELGIVDDRYLLARAGPSMTHPQFADVIGSLLPRGTPLRTVAPGDTKFVRVASGVLPPVVMKSVFGEFAAAVHTDDPAFFDADPAWHDANIETRTVPLLGDVTCHRKLFPQLIGALREVKAEGLGGLIHVYSGCYAPRTVARRSTAPPSQHAYGAAIDINAPENPFGSPPTMDPRVVEVFERWGFIWGGDFLIPDGMHFEYGGPPD